MSALKFGRILVALKATLSTPIVDGKHTVLQVLSSFESYMSALKVDRIFIGLKATVDMNANSHCWQDSGSSESYGYRVKTVADPAEKEILNVAELNFS